MRAKSFRVETLEEINNELEQVLLDGFEPTLAMVFSSYGQDVGAISQLLSDKNISVFGSTTVGEFVDGELGINSNAILLMDINLFDFEIILAESAYGKDEATAGSIAKKGLDKFSNPAFFICGSNVSADGQEITNGLVDYCGEDVTIFGGMAGAEIGVWTDSLVFTNGIESDFGILALIIDSDKYEFHGLASCGWEGFGTTKVVTSSDRNWVHTIDDKPALDSITKYLGIKHKIKNREYDPLPVIAQHPLQLVREDGSFVMRSPMYGNWETKSFMCAGSVPEGSKVRFSLPADFEVIDSVIEEAKEFRSQIPHNVDALIIFSCFARFVAFGPLLCKENQGIKDICDAPMAGFFTFGEFGKAKNGKQEFHNITCSWVAIKEKI
jgi:hypothetical protein